MHGKIHNIMRKLRLDYDAVFKDVDLLVMPTLPWVAKKMLVGLVAVALPKLSNCYHDSHKMRLPSST